MTSPSPTDSTVRFTDTVKTRASSARPAAENWDGWENWLAARLDQRCEAVYEAVGTALGELTGPLEKRIKALELQLAETRGALDVLRDGALDVLRDKGASSTDNVNETIDKIRTDFQEKVKEIELRLAETIGTVDVLRGKGSTSAALSIPAPPTASTTSSRTTEAVGSQRKTTRAQYPAKIGNWSPVRASAESKASAGLQVPPAFRPPSWAPPSAGEGWKSKPAPARSRW
jgi:hypothetical protein